MKRTTCGACGGTDLTPFLDLGSTPIADAYTAGPDDPAPRYPLQAAVCEKCRLVQLLEVVAHDVLFGTGYSFYSSASPPLSAYHEQYAEQVLRTYLKLALHGVVEVGCNDGDMLRHFTGFPALGVDPAEGPAAAAQARGLDVLVRPFGLAAAHDIRDHRGRQGLVIANHVLAHVADVSDVLAGIRALLADDGVAMVEVQYLPDLLLNNAIDLLYHEHRNFFSLTSLEQAALRHGLHIADAELTARQGGSLRVTLTTRASTNFAVDHLRASERWLNSICAYDGMQGRAERIRARLWDLLDAAPGPVAGYGAPAKATTLLHFCGIDHRHLTHVVDTTPAKQDRHIPGTGIRIVAPEQAPRPGAYLLLAHNYSRVILRQENSFISKGGRFVIPIPSPVTL